MITALLGLLTPAIKPLLDLIPNPAEREKARMAFELQLKAQELEFVKLAAQADAGQVEINKIEAAHSSLFVSGARPFIMWTCGAAFAWAFVVQPFAVFVLAAVGHPVVGLPNLNMGEMMPVLMGMLGLGSMRSWEKSKGVASK